MVDLTRFTLLLVWALCALGCDRRSEASAQDGRKVLTVLKEQQATWVRNFNPLLPPDTTRWPTPAGIYEPLLIFNSLKGEYVPWLATEYRWEENNRRLHFVLRNGVRWSDGQPFSAEDVRFTLTLLKRFPALDLHGIWKHLDRVETAGDREVLIVFNEVYVPGFFRIAQQPIVPAHIWKDIADPVTFRNPTPVATGPFTEVRVFQDQVYELGKNPNYWQPDKPQIDGLRFPAIASNEAASLALIKGQLDWAALFIPNIDRVFVKRDPEHHGYWFPRMGGVATLWVNNTEADLSDVRVRKALSMGIDRERIVNIAMFGYTRPADSTGLSDAYRDWSRPDVVDASWTRHQPEAAAAALNRLGFHADDAGVRRGPDGRPLDLELQVVSGWSDFVNAAQIIARDLAKIGVRVQIRTYEHSLWYENLRTGKFQLSLGFAREGPTPYEYFRFVMSGAARRPVGEPAVYNYGRFKAQRVDELLSDFEKTSDVEQQRELATELQRAFSRHAPTLPLFPSPSWGQYSLRRFTGFPNARTPFARLSPYQPPEYLLVLLNLKPNK